MSDVVVVSVGARTPVGLNARQTGFLLRAGFPAMAESPIATSGGEPVTMAFVPTLDGRTTGPERLTELARSPFEEATAPVRDAAADVSIAIDEGCEEPAVAIHQLGAMVRRALPSARVRVEAGGEAAPGSHLTAAIQALDARRADVAVVGGVHSDHDPRSIAALEASGRLFSRENLDARIPGESAAFFVLMRAADASRRRLPALARVIGVGAGRERARPDNEDGAYEALGLTSAVRQATAMLAADGRTAGWLFTDLTFEMWRQYEWQSAWVRSQKVLGNPYIIEAPAQRIGYLGAAALPLFVVIAATAWSHGYAPSPLALAMAGNDGGARAALLIGEV